MREILFRGKHVDNGEWVEGCYCRAFRWTGDKEPVPAIQEADCYYFRAIIPETVGQYTGLCDRNGTRIFEGDIVRHIQEYEISDKVESIAVIKWNEVYTCWSVEYTNGRITTFLGTEYHKIEVIGNIHDNPELMEVT